jgi:hypothetical protein
VIPNGQVVHHGCLPGDASQYHICPVTGEDFRETCMEVGLDPGYDEARFHD